MNITFYYDPICPWCWITSRWILQVKDSQNLTIDWRPFSLAIKNGHPLPASDDAEALARAFAHTSNLLEVSEALRERDQHEKIEDFYTYVGMRIHKDNVLSDEAFSIDALIRDALQSIGADDTCIEAAKDPAYTRRIKASTEKAITIAGGDIGVPLITLTNHDGEEVGLFGPVISALPQSQEQADAMWSAFVTLAQAPDFWEIKRTRTCGPNIDSTIPRSS